MVATMERLLNTAANMGNYHGIQVLDLHVGDPLPTPRAPIRYAVRVTPDLARYLLSFNHPNNRSLKERKIQTFAGDMRTDAWQLSPHAILFSRKPQLEDGQNRLMAVTVAGVDVWMILDFGWPEDIIYIVDRNTPRNNADAMKMDAIPSPTVAASTANKVHLFHETVGTPRSWNGLPAQSSTASLRAYRQDEEAYRLAVARGDRIYRALRGLTPTTWAAALFVIGEVNPDAASEFAEHIIAGDEPADSPTRRLGSPALYANRPEKLTRTGDRREPFENIIRAFNAWCGDRRFSAVTQPGFSLSRPSAPLSR